MKTSTEYISVACNRVPHAADWGRNGLVCYAAGNAVAIHDPGAGRVLQTLHRHLDRVNVVRWVKGPATTEQFVSGSADGQAVIWSRDSLKGFAPTSSFPHAHGVSIVDAVSLRDRLLLCTGTTGGEVKLWWGGDQRFQILETNGKLPIEAALGVLPVTGAALVALALEDSSVQVFSGEAEGTFSRVLTLQGHEDWVRCIDFAPQEDESVLVATGSQDNTIRLWRISLAKDSLEDEGLSLKKQRFEVQGATYDLGVESVMSSHEGWVYGVHWSGSRLLSCSLDKSLIVWEPDPGSGIWLETVRLGEVGGNSLGFYGCKFGANGERIMAHGFQGSFHFWERSRDGSWVPQPAPGGHFGEVSDLFWEPKGRFLVTGSADQTTRIHLPWKQRDRVTWHEIGRPQVHGYDVTCLASISPYSFASGAEEKVVRIFQAPNTFVNYLRRFSSAEDHQDHHQSSAESASVPALGLTNKAVLEDGVQDEGELDYGRPPTEEELIRHTLWPESEKLYGHGYEIFCMAARGDSRVLATACRSTNIEHGAILLWSTGSWSVLQKLVFHQLTVTQLSFSPDGRYLVSVSRDRRWALFRATDDHRETYELASSSKKCPSLHSRIIWTCCWSPDSKCFATGSRDGKVGLWGVDGKSEDPNPILLSSIERTEGVTSLTFDTRVRSKEEKFVEVLVLALGLESGRIEVHEVGFQEGGEVVWERIVDLDTSQAHHSTVKRLKFRPIDDIETQGMLQLASCGSDGVVKIHNIEFEE